MRLLSRYIAGKFFRPFFFSLGLFAVLIFLGDVFDRMNMLSASRASIGRILEYLWLGVPYWMIRTIPMATLLATLLTVSGFVQSGEWIGVLAGGYENKDLWLPILACSGLVALGGLLAQETILPMSYSRRQRLWQEKIHPEWQAGRYRNVALLGGPGEMIEAESFWPREGRLERPTLEIIGPDGVSREIDAQEALWDSGKSRWVFRQGVERIKGPRGFVATFFQDKISDLAVPPALLIPNTREPDEMSLWELRRYARRLSHLGASTREFAVALQSKIAYPFTNIVLCALGVPLALRLRRAPKAASFSIAVATSFVYLFVIEISRALGNSGLAPAMLAAWLPNLIFGGAGAWLLSQTSGGAF